MMVEWVRDLVHRAQEYKPFYLNRIFSCMKTSISGIKQPRIRKVSLGSSEYNYGCSHSSEK